MRHDAGLDVPFDVGARGEAILNYGYPPVILVVMVTEVLDEWKGKEKVTRTESHYQLEETAQGQPARCKPSCWYGQDTAQSRP